MKKIKNSLIILLATGLMIPLNHNCKKGENDPGLSFRSRDGRITGTWQLSSLNRSKVQTIETKTDNDGDGESDQDIKQIFTNTFKLENTSEFSFTSKLEKVDNKAASNNCKFSTTGNYDVDIKITINKDGTYKFTAKLTRGDVVKCGGDNDGRYCDQINQCKTFRLDENPVREFVETGDWFWTDSKKKKVGIRLISRSRRVINELNQVSNTINEGAFMRDVIPVKSRGGSIQFQLSLFGGDINRLANNELIFKDNIENKSSTDNLELGNSVFLTESKETKVTFEYNWVKID